MKRFSLISVFAGLLLFAASGVASAHGGGSHGGAAGAHGAAVRGGGWRGGGHPAYGWRGGPTYSGVSRGYAPRYSVAPYGGWAAHPYSSVGIGLRPSPRHVWVPGYWAWRGGARVWLGGAWLLPQPNWLWVAPHWQWDGYRWVWQEGYYAPPY